MKRGGGDNAYRVMVRIYKQYTLLAKPRRGWDDMKMITRNCMGRHGLDSSDCGDYVNLRQVLTVEPFASRDLRIQQVVEKSAPLTLKRLKFT
jgi:hypothetical protein